MGSRRSLEYFIGFGLHLVRGSGTWGSAGMRSRFGTSQSICRQSDDCKTVADRRHFPYQILSTMYTLECQLPSSDVFTEVLDSMENRIKTIMGWVSMSESNVIDRIMRSKLGPLLASSDVQKVMYECQVNQL